MSASHAVKSSVFAAEEWEILGLEIKHIRKVVVWSIVP
jgi:hypothetical protein